MKTGYGLLIAAGSFALLLTGSAAAQNSTGLLTPFSTAAQPSAFAPPMLRPGTGGNNGGGNNGGGSNGGGSHGDGGHHGHHEFPVFVTPFFGGFSDDNNMEVQAQPVNPQPFAPAESPLPGSRPVAPYKPPSVEIAPGGVEIVRGPGQ